MKAVFNLLAVFKLITERKQFWWKRFLKNVSLLDALLGRGWWYIYYDYFMIIDQNIYFLMKDYLQQQSPHYFHTFLTINQFLFFNSIFYFFIFLFLSFLLINSIAFTPERWIFCHLLSFFPRFWLFLIHFWMLWLLITVNKLKHMTWHISGCVHRELLLKEHLLRQNFLVYPVRLVWYWSHASWVTIDKH